MNILSAWRNSKTSSVSIKRLVFYFINKVSNIDFQLFGLSIVHPFSPLIKFETIKEVCCWFPFGWVWIKKCWDYENFIFWFFMVKLNFCIIVDRINSVFTWGFDGKVLKYILAFFLSFCKINTIIFICWCSKLYLLILKIYLAFDFMQIVINFCFRVFVILWLSWEIYWALTWTCCARTRPVCLIIIVNDIGQNILCDQT